MLVYVFYKLHNNPIGQIPISTSYPADSQHDMPVKFQEKKNQKIGDNEKNDF